MIPEYIWRKAEQNQIRRERGRLIKAGTITFRAYPNVLVRADSDTMVKDGDGKWKFPTLSAQG